MVHGPVPFSVLSLIVSENSDESGLTFSRHVDRDAAIESLSHGTHLIVGWCNVKVLMARATSTTRWALFMKSRQNDSTARWTFSALACFLTFMCACKQVPYS